MVRELVRRYCTLLISPVAQNVLLVRSAEAHAQTATVKIPRLPEWSSQLPIPVDKDPASGSLGGVVPAEAVE